MFDGSHGWMAFAASKQAVKGGGRFSWEKTGGAPELVKKEGLRVLNKGSKVPKIDAI